MRLFACLEGLRLEVPRAPVGSRGPHAGGGAAAPRGRGGVVVSGAQGTVATPTHQTLSFRCLLRDWILPRGITCRGNL